MQLLLIRHALPHRSEPGEGSDPDLSADGVEQANRLPDALARFPITRLVSSPQRRAVQTAEPVAERLGLEPIYDDELAEFDRQSHFYIPIEELKEEKNERWDDLISGRWGADGEVDPATFKAVVVEAVERVIAANRGKTVAVVCHGGVINAYYADMLGLEFPMFFEPAYTSISRVLASSAGQRQVKSINEHAHVRSMI
ncbi:MAG TPA: histidine phosphatase family protein [Ilumatobacteraceae bacterium]